jgi:hypothetical protein
MMSLDDNLSLYAYTPLPDALVSFVRKFFDSKPFGDWQKSREAEQKIQVTIVNRIDNLTGA